MGFPAFAPEARKVLFFSRGRGRGHAVPDIEVIRALGQLQPDAEVRIVSYSTGAETFAEFNYPLIDVGLPDTSPIAEMSVIAARLIGGLRPDVVVAHEEFPAAPAAKIFDRPSIVIIDFFDDPSLYSMAALKFADHILFTGEAGVFEEPPWVQTKVEYVGPIIRKFQYSRCDRERARQELGIPSTAFVVSVFPGSWMEEIAPVLDLVLGAWDKLRAEGKVLVWVAGRDRELVRRAVGNRRALVLERDWAMDRLMVAADVALTKMNRTTAIELRHLQIPQIGLSSGLNPIDDRAVRALEGVICLDTRQAGPTELADTIEAISLAPPRATRPNDAAERCARRIADFLTRENR